MLHIGFTLTPGRLTRTECIMFLKTTLCQLPKHSVSKSTPGHWSCFPFPGISYGQDESNLVINLFKGTLIEMLMFRCSSLKTKCSREVTLDELKRSRALFLANTLLTAKQWENEDFLSKVGSCREKAKSMDLVSGRILAPELPRPVSCLWPWECCLSSGFSLLSIL